MQSFDLVIVGGSMVGLAVALGMAESGKKIAVVDHAPPPQTLGSEYELRVSALNLASLHWLESLGIGAEIKQRNGMFSRMQVWQADAPGELNVDAASQGQSLLGRIVENRLLQQALFARAQQQANISLCYNTQIVDFGQDERQAWLQTDHGLLCGQLLVGADGAESQLRQSAHIPLTFRDYAHTATVATIRTQQPHGDCARQIFTDKGILAFLPLPEPDLCSIVWSAAPTVAQELKSLDEQAFNRRLSATFQMRLGLCQRQSELQQFPLRMRYARSFVKQRLVLAGDAAHTIHPLAGQGLNLGLADAACLVECLLANLKAGRELADRHQLRRYERWRKGEALAMISAMGCIKQLFEPDLVAFKWLRGIGMQAADQMTPLKQFFVRRAMGLEGELPQAMQMASWPLSVKPS